MGGPDPAPAIGDLKLQRVFRQEPPCPKSTFNRHKTNPSPENTDLFGWLFGTFPCARKRPTSHDGRTWIGQWIGRSG